MSYELEIGRLYRDPDDCEVYGYLKTGGCFTVFRGTEQQCREEIERNPTELRERLAQVDREGRT